MTPALRPCPVHEVDDPDCNPGFGEPCIGRYLEPEPETHMVRSIRHRPNCVSPVTCGNETCPYCGAQVKTTYHLHPACTAEGWVSFGTDGPTCEGCLGRIEWSDPVTIVEPYLTVAEADALLGHLDAVQAPQCSGACSVGECDRHNPDRWSPLYAAVRKIEAARAHACQLQRPKGGGR